MQNLRLTFHLNGDHVCFLGVVLGVTLCVMVSVVACHWGKVRKAEADAQITRDMIAAGFSADDIERVIRTSAIDDARPGNMVSQKYT